MIYGSATSPFLDLEPSWDPDTGLGTHGEWDAAITPTEPGNYTFHFTGTIDGQAIDQRFTSSDSTFDVVRSPTAIEFPTKTPSPAELAAGVEALQPRVGVGLVGGQLGQGLGLDRHDARGRRPRGRRGGRCRGHRGQRDRPEAPVVT